MSRRVARRRAELGLSIEQVADETGIDPGYLRYFEDHADARLSAGSTLLLALALQTTAAALEGRGAWPAGRGRAGPHPQLQWLTPEQCEAHLSAGGVGRVVFSTKRGPVALPVNYEYTEGHVVISTDVAKAAALESQHTVGFEIDRIDDVMSEGWSVLVTGPARRVDDPEEILALSSLDLESWAGGDRHALVVIIPKEITGRVIIHPVVSVE
jgi:transcriptional regulator with XRE-family HTH domain